MLLQKSDGTFEIIIWNGSAAISDGKADLAVQKSLITVAFGNSQQLVRLYDPIVSSTALKTMGATQSVSFYLGADPIIIEVPPVPKAPTIISVSPDSALPGDHITNAKQVVIAGKAQPTSTVQVYDGNTKLGAAVVRADGNWSYTTAKLVDGKHLFSSKAVNAVGNASAASAALLVTIDTVAPTAPKIVSDALGSNNTMVVSGTAEAGSKIAVYEGTTLLGSGVADAQGNWTIKTISLAAGVHNFVATATDAAGNVSQLSNVFDPVIGTVIESVGSVSLVQVGKDYYLSGGGTDFVLKHGGNVFVAGQFGAWNPLGVEATSTGYDVAWKNSSTGLYTVWSVDKSGNWASDLLSNVSGSNTALKAIESLLNQDLNGDGTIGAPVAQSGGTATKMIEAIGDTSLSQAGSNYLLTPASGGAGLLLKYGGNVFVAGQFGAWNPLGVETTATGYDVAWKNSSTGLYTVWSVDKNGNWASDLLSNVSGSSAAFKAMETLFHQDLNGDGVINTASTVIDVTGKLALDLGNMSQTATIAAGASLELTGAVSGSITFKAVTGTLILDKSAQFTGKIYGLSGDGNPNSSDILDLRDIAYGTGTKVSFSGDTSGGVLTVTDAQNHSAHLTLVGDYTHSTFNLTSDGAGGTLVIDPPMSGFKFAPAPAAASAATPPAQHDTYTGEGDFHVQATSGVLVGPQPVVDDHHVLPDQAVITQEAHIQDIHHFILR
jgi:20S proteasome alpha/beta subunit